MHLLPWQQASIDAIGTETFAEDVMQPDHSNALLAALNDASTVRPGDALPPLFHWLHFNAIPRADQLKADGHERLGDFLPPVAYPRRMWAGSEVQFIQPIILGTPTQRRSVIRDVTFKQGASGPLCFVAVEHRISQGDVACLQDTHTIVYKEASLASMADMPLAPPNENAADPVLLFRYSALTYNGHRIHYDALYAREVERYPGIVVHGPLMATLLLRAGMASQPDRPVRGFRFRGLAPLFATEGFTITVDHAGDTTHLMLEKTDGTHCIRGEAVWA